MRIALVCDWYRPRVGGMEMHLEQLAQRLVAAGHLVTVITPTPGPESREFPLRVIRMPAVLWPWHKVIWTPTAFLRLRRVLKSDSFDVVHIHGSTISPASFGALWFAPRLGLPTVYTVHSYLTEVVGIMRGFDRLLGWSRWPVVYSGVSEQIAEHLRTVTAGAPVEVVNNAIDPAEWKIEPRAAEGDCQVACVMRLTHRKRGHALISQLPSILARLPAGSPFWIKVAGDGPQRWAIERRARRLGVADRIEFLGTISREQVKELFSRSHIFILPSTLEAFGIAALEARAAGLPIVAMRGGGVSGFIEDGREGLLADDDASFADAIVRLATDRALRDRIALHNRTTPVAFTWERALEEHLSAYGKACRRLAQISAEGK